MWIKAKGGALVNMEKVFSVEMLNNKVVAYSGDVSINDKEDVEYGQVVLGEFEYRESAAMYLEVLTQMLEAADVEKKYAERMDAEDLLRLFKTFPGVDAEFAETLVNKKVFGKKGA